jgi:predicted outer membrane repeat protein
VNNSTLTLTNSTVSSNTAGDYGGGIANSGTLTPTNAALST